MDNINEQEQILATAVQAVARALRDLGNGNAATHMGAIETHGLAVKEAGDNIASAIRELADAIRDRS